MYAVKTMAVHTSDHVPTGLQSIRCAWWLLPLTSCLPPGEVEKLLQLLTTLREHQASYEQDKEQLRDVIGQLNASLSLERERSQQLRDQVGRLNASLSSSQAAFEQLHRDLGTSRNLTDALNDHLLHLQHRMDQKDHLLPRTLKGELRSHWQRAVYR